MKSTYLFPYRYKWVSGIVFIVSFVMFIAFYTADEYLPFEYKAKVFAIIGEDDVLGPVDWFGWIENSITDEILFTLTIIAGLVFAFSREKHEDEMVASLRLNSLVKATLSNYLILLFLYLTVYGLPFLNVLNAAMFSQLIIFIVLFRISMYRFNTLASHEE